jgi:hypothetical protein
MTSPGRTKTSQRSRPEQPEQNPRSASALPQLLEWWSLLSEDDRDLLRATHEAVEGNQPALAWLAWIGCPLVVTTERTTFPYELTDADLLNNFLSHM